MNRDVLDRSIFRYTSAVPGEEYKLVLDNTKSELRLGPRLIHLEPLAFELLSILMARAGELIARDSILEFLSRDEAHGHASGGQVLNNTVSYLRRRLKAEIGPHAADLIKTGRGGYFFDAGVTAEAQGSEAPAETRLTIGDHVATARAILIEKIGSNAGIEEWIGHRSDNPKQPCRLRIATAAEGARRLRHEKQVFDHLNNNDLARGVVLQPRSNLKMPTLQSLTWDWPPYSLAHLDDAHGFLGKLAPSDRLHLVRRLVSAVEALNQAGVVHGDLKPADILLTRLEDVGRRNFEAVDLEIGLGGLAHAFVEPSASGSANSWGTQNRSWRNRRSDSQAYRAPELLDGSPTDLRSDVYALGIILYKIFAGSAKLPFEANWQDDIECPVLREDIAASTARDPEKRLASAAELAQRLERYESRSIAARSQIDALAKAERARKRRPLIVSVFAVLGITAISLGFLTISLKSANDRVEAQAIEAAMARDALRSILLSADPRSAPGNSSESVDQLLERASQAASKATTDPLELATLNLILAEAYRGRGDVKSELQHLKSALTPLLKLGDPERVATTRYALANSLLIAGGTSAAANRQQAIKQIALANGDYARVPSPSADLRAARFYAEGMVKSQNGDFAEALDGFRPWIAIVRQNDIPLDRREFNAVVLVAQAQLRTGGAENALETLEWLRSRETDAIPQYIRINRMTMQALASSVLGREDTTARFEQLLDLTASIYGEGSVPEGTTRNYYGIHLEGIGRLRDAEENQRRSRSIFCERQTTALYCEAPRINLASIMIKQGRYSEAARQLNIVESVFLEDFPVGHAQVTFLRGLIEMGCGDWSTASVLFRRVSASDLEAASPAGNWQDHLLAMRMVSEQTGHASAVVEAAGRMSMARVPESSITWVKGLGSLASSSTECVARRKAR